MSIVGIRSETIGKQEGGFVMATLNRCPSSIAAVVGGSDACAAACAMSHRDNRCIGQR